MNQNEYNASVEIFKAEIPQSKICYTPSGITPVSSIILLLLLSLAVSAIGYSFGRFICHFYYDAVGNTGFTSGTMLEQFKHGRDIALGALLVNFVIFIVIGYTVMFSYKFVAQITKLRNPKIGQIFAFFSVFIVCAALYLPLYGGYSLAPTDLTFFLIPVRWLLMIIGVLILPLILSFTVRGTLISMKFCEATNKTLKKVAIGVVSWSQGIELIQLLNNKQYDSLSNILFNQNNKSDKPVLIFTLFGHPEATSAFIDVEAKFEKLIGSSYNETTTTWIVYHEALSKNVAIDLFNHLPSHTKKINIV